MNTKATRFSNVKRRISDSLSNFGRAIVIVGTYIISSATNRRNIKVVLKNCCDYLSQTWKICEMGII